MIRYFDRNETNFNHNETMLNPISCFVVEEANGMFEIECELDKSVIVGNSDIIKAPTPRGEQLFRVYRVKKSLKGKMVYAKHIFYDLSKNFIVNVELNNVSSFTAIQSVLSNCEVSHNFIAISDVLTQNSATYTRINPVQAIIGNENSILNLYGGNLIRDNFKIDIKAQGTDRGYEIRLGKNLIGIDADIDESSVKTKMYPIVELDDSTITLPEKYVDSPLINNYEEPIISTVEIKLTDDQKQLYADEQLSMDDIYNIMRSHCNDLFEKANIDKPLINYKVDFVELSKTEQYKDLAILEQLDLYDIVTVNVSHLDINVKARVIKYKYDCMKERYENIELGDFSSVSNYKTDNLVKQLQSGIKASQSAADYATNVITGNKGGYVVIRRYPDGKPYEILIMDTEDINTAQNLFRLNNSGLGFSRTGYNGTYDTAMTIDGHIVADYIDTGILTSILLKSANYIDNISGMKINLADGTIDSKNFKVDVNGNITSTGGIIQSGNYVSNNSGTKINLSDGSINSKNFKLDSSGNITSTGGVFQSSHYIEDNSGMKINLANGTIDSKNFKVDSSGTITAVNGKFLSNGGNGTVDIVDGKIVLRNTNLEATARLDGSDMWIDYIVVNKTANFIGGINFQLNSAPTLVINGVPQFFITSANMLNYLADKVHNHNGVYADSSHRQSSYTITPELTSSDNISLYGSPNAASTWWCERTFEPKSSSDFRLKKNIQSLNLPDELFMSLKPKSFEYKCDDYNKGQVFGLISQQVESAFKKYGYDPYSYNLIELVDPKSAYTDEGLYVDDKVHRINYMNLIPWNISITQKLYNEVDILKGTVQSQQNIIDSQSERINELEVKVNEMLNVV